MDSNELCNALHVAIKSKDGSIQMAGIVYKLEQSGIRLSKEDEGLVLDYMQFFRNCNVLRWGLNTYTTNAEPPFMHLTKYGENVFAKEASLISLKETFLELYNAT